MSTRKKTGPARAKKERPWHHGDLLRELTAAADALVTAGGVGSVTLRAVASRVKPEVSHTAAMAHVGSIPDLLAYVALRWWEKLVARLVEAGASLPPHKRLVAYGLSYRDFAVANPQHFRLMYDERIWRAINPLPRAENGASSPAAPKGFKYAKVLYSTRNARDEAYGLFEKAVEDGQRVGSLRLDRPAELMARLVASLSHGLAMEGLDEGLTETEVKPLLEFAVAGMRSSSR